MGGGVREGEAPILDLVICNPLKLFRLTSFHTFTHTIQYNEGLHARRNGADTIQIERRISHGQDQEKIQRGAIRTSRYS